LLAISFVGLLFAAQIIASPEAAVEVDDDLDEVEAEMETSIEDAVEAEIEADARVDADTDADDGDADDVVAVRRPSDPPVPQPPAALMANTTFTSLYEGRTTVTMGYMWYDLSANSRRSDWTAKGIGASTLELFARQPNAVIEWIELTTPPACSTSPIFGPVTVDMFSWITDSSAAYQGQVTIDGQPTYLWNCTSAAGPSQIWMALDSVTPIRMQIGSPFGDYDQWDWSLLIASKPDPSVFTIPSFCPSRAEKEKP